MDIFIGDLAIFFMILMIFYWKLEMDNSYKYKKATRVLRLNEQEKKVKTT